jgi:hypothetical protein
MGTSVSPWSRVAGALLEAANAAKGQELTLVHLSAQHKPCLTQKHTLHTPKHPLTPPKQPLNASHIPQKVLTLS